MSIRDWMIERLGGITPEQFRSQGWDVVLEAWKENRENDGGISSPDSSLKMAAVFACVRVLSEAIASVPLHHYQLLENGGRKRADDLPVAKVLESPNPFQTGFEFTENLMKSLLLWGNAYSQITYDSAGRITELWPLLPQNMLESKIKNGNRIYLYQEETGNIKRLSSDIVWHVRGLGNGFTGYSPIGLMRQTVALGMSAETYGKKFFDNDARPGIVVEHPSKLSDSALKNLKDSWNEDHKGASKAHRMRVLEEGMKLHEVGIPPQDAQFLETRKFQVTEIARIFRVPPHMIADLDKASFSNIEHQGIEFVKFSVLSWAKRIESSISKNLYIERERMSFYPEYLLAGLERGDISSRYSAYATGRQWGWLSANDVRRMENQDPVNGGDMYMVPLNMVAADGSLSKGDDKPSADSTQKKMNREEEKKDAKKESRSYELEKEVRALRSVTARHRLTVSYRRIMQEAAERSIRRETNDVSAAAKKMLGNRNTAEFNLWLENFYTEHIEFMTRQFLPVFLSFAESIAAEAQDEVADEQDLQDRLEKFVRAYTGSFAYSQSQISLNRLKNALQEALDSGTDPEEGINNELEHWKEVRANEIVMDQSTRQAGAVAKFVYTVVGIMTLRWVTLGDSCPYCKAMNGRTISINKLFLAPGEEFQPDGADNPMTTTTDIGHPPLHGGCDCGVAAG